MNKVFLSYSKPINIQQDAIIKYIKYKLQHEGFFPVETQNENYDISPVYVINKTIKECDFFLCIAYEKEKVVDANGAILYCTSSWLDIEIALAISHQVPIFIIKEEKLAETALLNSTDSVFHYSLPNTINNLIDFEYLKENIIPELMEYIKISTH